MYRSSIAEECRKTAAEYRKQAERATNPVRKGDLRCLKASG
jgi:hypothetical protein